MGMLSIPVFLFFTTHIPQTLAVNSAQENAVNSFLSNFKSYTIPPKNIETPVTTPTPVNNTLQNTKKEILATPPANPIKIVSSTPSNNTANISDTSILNSLRSLIIKGLPADIKASLQGPAGPQGPQGPSGPAGAQGAGSYTFSNPAPAAPNPSGPIGVMGGFASLGVQELNTKTLTVTGNQTNSGTLTVTGNQTNAGTLTVSGNATFSDNITGASLYLGSAGTTKGVLRLAGDTSGNVTIQPASIAGTWSLTLPSDDGTSGQVLKTDGNGVTSWNTIVNGITIGDSVTSATAGSIFFAGASGVLAQNNSSLFWDRTNSRLGIGTNTPVSTLEVAGVIRSSGADPQIYLDSTTSDWIMQALDSSGNFRIREGGVADRLVIAQSSGNVGIANSAPGALLDLGLAGTTKGVLRVAGDTSGNITLQPASTAGTWTWTLPANDGTSGQVLQTDGNGISSWVNGGGAGANPGGADTLLQYNNSGSFGGIANITTDGTNLIVPSTGSGMILSWHPTNYATQNGPLGIFLGSSSNLPGDVRRDDQISIGINNSSQIGAMSTSILNFESYCTVATGCGTPQNETYFSVGDGTGGHGGRPLAFNYTVDGSNTLTALANSNTWIFSNLGQTEQRVVIDTNGLDIQHGSIYSSYANGTDWIKQNNTSLIRLDAGGVQVSPSSELLLGRVDELGSHYVKVLQNLQLNFSDVYSSNGKVRISLSAGDDNYFQTVNTATSGGGPELRTIGADTNVDMVFRPKGSGKVAITYLTGNNGGYFPIFNDGNRNLIEGSVSGSTSKVVTTTGSLTTNHCAKWDASGNLIDSGAGCGGAGSLSIGDSVGSATEGSILFAGASGVLAQDNAGLFWNNTDNKLGIGKSPTYAVDVLGSLRLDSGDPHLMLSADSGTDWALQALDSSGNFRIRESGVGDRVTIVPGGYVGIDMGDPSVALDVTGDIEYTGSLTDVSDMRLKENITDFGSGLDILNSIGVKNYNMIITPDRAETGFIAQNVKEYFPQAVSIIDPTNGYMGVSYVSFIPVLTKAVQELDLKITDLDTRVSLLENNSGNISNSNSLGQYVSAFFTSSLQSVVDGVAYIKGIITDTLTVGSVQKPAGIQMFDPNGAPYCVKVLVGGTLASEAGNCKPEVTETPTPPSNPTPDTTPPVITLNGDVNINILVGEIYTELGATATDATDGSVSVVASGSVDTNTVGIYTIHYNATDSANNNAIELTRTINVTE